VRSVRFLTEIPAFLRFVLRRWTEDKCPQIAGSLAFTTLLALVPVFAIVVALLSSAPFFEDVMVQFKVFLLLNLVPEIAGRIITGYLEPFAHNAARLTTVGVAFLLVTAVALMFTVDRSINAIWRSTRERPFWLALLGYVSLIVMGPLLIGISVSVTTYLMSLSAGLVSHETGWRTVVLRAIPAAVSAVAFFLIYRIVPQDPVPWRHALAGGIVTGILFEAAKEVFAFYVRMVPSYSLVYGTFAAVPLFLVWVYVSWLVVLFGAELTASLGHWKGPPPREPVRTRRRGKGRSAGSSR
jgi:membrane protein